MAAKRACEQSQRFHVAAIVLPLTAAVLYQFCKDQGFSEDSIGLSLNGVLVKILCILSFPGRCDSNLHVLFGFVCVSEMQGVYCMSDSTCSNITIQGSRCPRGKTLATALLDS